MTLVPGLALEDKTEKKEFNYFLMSHLQSGNGRRQCWRLKLLHYSKSYRETIY
jgi:hypothetical protein